MKLEIKNQSLLLASKIWGNENKCALHYFPFM